MAFESKHTDRMYVVMGIVVLVAISAGAAFVLKSFEMTSRDTFTQRGSVRLPSS